MTLSTLDLIMKKLSYMCLFKFSSVIYEVFILKIQLLPREHYFLKLFGQFKPLVCDHFFKF